MSTEVPLMHFSRWVFTSRDERVMRRVANRLAERFRNVYIVQEGDHWIVELLIRWDAYEKDMTGMKHRVLGISWRIWRYIDKVQAEIDDTGELAQIPENRKEKKVPYNPFMQGVL